VRRIAASASGPTRAFPRPHLPEAGSTPKRLKVSPCHVPRLPSPIGRATMDRRSVPSPVRARPPRLPPYHGRDAVVPFVMKQAAAAYLRTLRQPRVCHRPCLPELVVSRHSRRHCGAPSCAPFHARPSCPTPSLLPTEAHPTALSHGRASTSPEQALPRLASGDAAEHNRRLLLRAVQPPVSIVGKPLSTTPPFLGRFRPSRGWIPAILAAACAQGPNCRF
jgi:hypothetical protein